MLPLGQSHIFTDIKPEDVKTALCANFSWHQRLEGPHPLIPASLFISNAIKDTRYFAFVPRFRVLSNVNGTNVTI